MKTPGRLLLPVALAALTSMCGGGDTITQANGTIVVAGGDNGSDTVGTAVVPGPTVLVSDAQGHPVAGVSVTFTPISGGGSVAGGSQLTDAAGNATVGSWTLGTTAGPNTLSASAPGYAGSPVVFTATGTPGPANQLGVTTQPSAGIASGVPFSRQPVVQLLDQYGNAVSQANVGVTAALVSGPTATLNGTTTVNTDPTGSAPFSDLSITGPNGSYTIGFSAAGLTAVASSVMSLGTPQGMLPLIDLGSGTYLGQFTGGLYLGGSNSMPMVHDSVGRARARNIRTLDASGNPSASGKIVLLSIGMSNASQEWCAKAPNNAPCDPWTFTGQAMLDPAVNHNTLVIANGAKGSQTAHTWTLPTDSNYDRVRDSVLAPQGLTEGQVQVIWFKDVEGFPNVSLPSSQADAYTLESEFGDIMRSMRVRYPQLQMVFLSSRTYGGYATTRLNPEPYAYETGFAMKWLIQAQINQMANGMIVDPVAGNLNYNTVAPYVAWGAYLWANGSTPRSDGLVWLPGDVEAVDGTHPSQAGETKVGTLLLNFFKTDPHAACWFLAGQVCP